MVLGSKYLVFSLLCETVLNLFTGYVEVEANKIIAKESRVSFDFEIDVSASQSSPPSFDDVLVQY
jgi:hypothetical protein